MSAHAAAALSRYQRFVVAALAFVQFTLVLDFMVISPLGAMLMPALRITPAQFGLAVSTYAFSAGVAGILAAGFADRFDRKKLLLSFYAGFLAGTLLCGLAGSYHFLVFARLVTGFFAGVVGSVSFAIITDLFPLELRGRAMGVVQTAFAASSVLGLPLSLTLANRWGWNSPFYLIVAVCTGAAVVIATYLRPVDAHLRQRAERSPLQHFAHTLSNRGYLQGFATTCLLSVGGFMLLPFMSAFIVHNVGVTLDKLPLIYVITGMASVVAGPLIGRASDTFGKFKVFCCGCAMSVVMVVIFTHLAAASVWVLCAVLALMQVGIFSRVISASALMSALPKPADRGSYMAISSSLQQMAGGIASILAGLIVVETTDGTLRHFDVLGYILVGTTLVTLTLMSLINRKIGEASQSDRALTVTRA